MREESYKFQLPQQCPHRLAARVDSSCFLFRAGPFLPSNTYLCPRPQLLTRRKVQEVVRRPLPENMPAYARYGNDDRETTQSRQRPLAAQNVALRVSAFSNATGYHPVADRENQSVRSELRPSWRLVACFSYGFQDTSISIEKGSCAPCLTCCGMNASFGRNQAGVEPTPRTFGKYHQVCGTALQGCLGNRR